MSMVEHLKRRELDLAAKIGAHAAASLVLGEALQEIARLRREQEEHQAMMERARESGFLAPAMFRTIDGLECLVDLASLMDAKREPDLVVYRMLEASERSEWADETTPARLDRRRYVLKRVTPHGVPVYVESRK